MFSISVLNALKKLESIIEIICIITKPDKKIGRKKNINFSPVKKFALINNISIFQPEKIINIYSELSILKPDIIFSCSYGQFIPEKILKLANINCINVHASLLPKLRGGAPIHKAIIYGEKKTGITLTKMIKQMDAGEIYIKSEILIDSNETFSSLHDRLMVLAEEITEKYLLDIIIGKIKGIPQNNKKATFAYNITRDEEKINWSFSKQIISNKIRGLYKKPIAYTKININNINYKLHKAVIMSEKLSEKDINFINGTIVDILKSGIKVKVNDGYLLITSLQRESKKVLDAKIYFYNSSLEIKIGNIFI